MSKRVGRGEPAVVVSVVAVALATWVVTFARVTCERRRGANGFLPTWILLAGYLGAWVVYGLAAYGLYRLIHGADLRFLRWDADGPYVSGGVVVLAGLYELTPLKRVCLRACRTPVEFIRRRWRDGTSGAFAIGLELGAVCVSCCWALFALLFAIGVMSVLWMALVAAVVFAERVLPRGDRIAPPLGAALVAFGIWIAVAPGSVPGLAAG